jgi:hypothetical protein
MLHFLLFLNVAKAQTERRILRGWRCANLCAASIPYATRLFDFDIAS